MPVSSVTITGPVTLPTATPYPFTTAYVSFKLTQWDKETDGAVTVAGPFLAPIDEDGNFSLEIFPTAAGVNTTNYVVSVIHRVGVRHIEETLGMTTVPAAPLTQTLASLDIVPIPDTEDTSNLLTQIHTYIDNNSDGGSTNFIYANREAFKADIALGNLDSIDDHTLIIAGSETYERLDGLTVIADIAHFRNPNQHEVTLAHHGSDLVSMIGEAEYQIATFSTKPNWIFNTPNVTVSSAIDLTTYPEPIFIQSDNTTITATSFGADQYIFTSDKPIKVVGHLNVIGANELTSPSFIKIDNVDLQMESLSVNNLGNIALHLTGSDNSNISNLKIDNVADPQLPIENPSLGTINQGQFAVTSAVNTFTGLTGAVIGIVGAGENGTTLYKEILSTSTSDSVAAIDGLAAISVVDAPLILEPLIGSGSSGSTTISTTGVLPDLTGRIIYLGNLIRTVASVTGADITVTEALSEDVIFKPVIYQSNILLDNCSNTHINKPMMNNARGIGIFIKDSTHTKVTVPAFDPGPTSKTSIYSLDSKTTSISGPIVKKVQTKDMGAIHCQGNISTLSLRGGGFSNLADYCPMLSCDLNPVVPASSIHFHPDFVDNAGDTVNDSWYRFEPGNTQFVERSHGYYPYENSSILYWLRDYNYPPVMLAAGESILLKYPHLQGKLHIYDYITPLKEYYALCGLKTYLDGTTPKLSHPESGSDTDLTIFDDDYNQFDILNDVANSSLGVLPCRDGIIIANNTIDPMILNMKFDCPSSIEPMLLAPPIAT